MVPMVLVLAVSLSLWAVRHVKEMCWMWMKGPPGVEVEARHKRMRENAGVEVACGGMENEGGQSTLLLWLWRRMRVMPRKRQRMLWLLLVTAMDV